MAGQHRAGSERIGASVLVVDNSLEILGVLADLLRGEGYQVRSVANGQQALRTAEHEPPDLMLLDVRMPAMDGYEVCRRFKADVRLRAIPIIFTSAVADTEAKIRAFTTGGVDFVAKPFEPEVVLARIRTHLALAITERDLMRRLEERTREVQQASRYARNLIEASLDPMVTVSPEGKITDVNRATEEATGGLRAGLIGSDFADLFTVPDDARSGYRRALAEGAVRDLGLTIRHAGGGTMDVLFNAAVYRSEDGRVEGILAAARDVTLRLRAETALRRTNRALKTLTSCNDALVHGAEEGVLLAEMCRIILEIGGYRLAWIGFVDAERQLVRPVAQLGFRPGFLDGAAVAWNDDALGRGPIGTVMRTGLPQVIQDTRSDPGFAPWRANAEKLGYASVLALPLQHDAAVFGVLSIHSAEAQAFDPEEMRLLAKLGDNLAYGIMALRTRAEHEHNLQRLETSMEATIQAIANTVEMRDPYTAGHQYRVAQLAEAIARELGMAEADIHGLYLACIVHDLGKIHIPAEILARPGRLSKVEFELIKTHATAGYELLQTIDFPWPIAEIVSQHHERLDGSGYPLGLGGADILFGARIMSVADVVEAMASHRPYRPALGIGAALSELEENEGRLYDSRVVAACLELFREREFAFQ